MKFTKIYLSVIILGAVSSNFLFAQVTAYKNLSGNFQDFAVVAPQGEMTKEQEEKLLKNFSNDSRSKLEEIKNMNKNKYYELLRSNSMFGLTGGDIYYGNNTIIGKELNWIKESNENYKKQKALEIDTELLALKYKNADSSEKSKIKNDLTSKLSELFDMKEAKKQDEVKQLEKRLQDLKESLQVRKENKDKIVQYRMQAMLGESNYLRW